MNDQKNSKPSILVVDDMTSNRLVMGYLLKSLDMEIDLAEASSGDRAIELCREKEFALILLDVQMPGLNGYEVAEILQQSESTREIPIIFVTANFKGDAHQAKGYSYGAVDYIEKPLNKRILISKVSVFLRLWRQKLQLAQMVGDLRETNDKMASEISERVKAEAALTSLKESLEILVEQRTHDLSEQMRRVEALAHDLVQRENIFCSIARFAPAGIFRADAQGRCVYVNETWCEVTGLTPEEAFGDGWRRCVHPTDRNIVNQAWQNLLENQQTLELEYQIEHKEGYALWVWGHMIMTKEEPFEIIGTIIDITRRRQDEIQLRQAATVFENSAEGVIITNADKKIVAVNKSFSKITGYDAKEVIGESPSMLESDHQDLLFYAQMWAQIETHGQWQGEICNRRKNGDSYPEWLSISKVIDQSGNLANYVVVFSDISALKASEEKVKYLAYHDQLTQLPNRALLKDRLQQALWRADRNGQLVAVIMLDLDHFKKINDSLGHDIGDALLVTMAERINATLSPDHTLARTGGDEYVIVMEEIDEPFEIHAGLQSILDSVAETIVMGGHELYMTTSLGISLYPGDADNVTDLLKSADVAMYKSKESGGNQYTFYRDEMNARSLEYLMMEKRLREAINGDKLRLFYQPQFDTRTGRLVGAEALVRLWDDTLGLIPPNEFIQLAEESGIIVALGEWVLAEACRQNKTWQDMGYPAIKMAVNLSGRQFSKTLVDSILSIVDGIGLDHQSLELEITESILMSCDSSAILQALHAQNIAIAMDDFGTGYSSLAYLKHFPIAKLKVDQSFVRNMTTDPGDEAIVNAIISMGHSLGLSVLAEGVETPMHLELLKLKGCDVVQGYLTGRPVSAGEFVAFFEQNHT